MLSVSCSQKKYTMRRLSDATGVESAIRANPNNTAAIEKLIDAVEYGNSSVRAALLVVEENCQLSTSATWSHVPTGGLVKKFTFCTDTAGKAV